MLQGADHDEGRDVARGGGCCGAGGGAEGLAAVAVLGALGVLLERLGAAVEVRRLTLVMAMIVKTAMARRRRKPIVHFMIFGCAQKRDRPHQQNREQTHLWESLVRVLQEYTGRMS